ncbi:MAG: S41 family peptidase [Planctomycetota bacterium]|jgi:carboxyl-terminal processing protease
MDYLLSQNSRNRLFKMKRTYLIGLSCFVWLFLLAGYGLAAQSENAASPQSVPADIAGDPVPIIEQICSNIYQGDFAGAREVLGPSEESKSTAIAQLVDIISEYEAVEKERQTARKSAYEEQLAELEKLRAGTDTNDVNDVIVNDVNDVNDIVDALSVIVKVNEFADEAQKEQLLSGPFVKEVMQKAIDKAAGFEVEGKWLEAYTNCYGWLGGIDPNNQGYSDYAKQLLDKATIAISLEDSPCETSEERFQGVRKEMFLRAINFLDLHYVIINNYGQMATKAIERCKLLAEVMKFSLDDFKVSLNKSEVENQKSQIEYQKSLSAWSSALEGLLEKVQSNLGEPTAFDKSNFIDVFEKVLKLNKSTVDLPQPVLIAHFAEAALASLDPYTVVVWPRQVQDFEQMMTNEFTGIGIEISKQQGLLTVSSLLLDTPAFNSDLDAGDVIEAVDDLQTKDMSLFCAAKKIKGPAGTKVRLTVRRPSEDKKVEDKVFDITITRDRIIVPTVRGWQRTNEGKWLYMIDDKSKIGYVRITSFSAETASGLEEVLVKLEGEGMRGLIMDLRYNTGGLLDSAVAVADKFIEEDWIVKRQPRFGRMPIYESAHKKGTHPNYPLVILINSSSASASEIVAGALADEKYERAILVGTRTHGKGSVQGITGYLGGGAQLKYTMAYYHLPSGQRVESRDAMKKQDRKDWGVGPDIEVGLRSDELKKMVEVQRHNDVLVKADHDNANHDFEKHTIKETLVADPQLAVGLLIVRSKLIQVETLAQARLTN